MSSYQLVEVATGWAQRNNFSNEQMVEFSHLMQMIGLTYIPRWQVTQYQELDRGSFGTIYKALYDGSPVAVKQLSSVSNRTPIPNPSRLLITLPLSSHKPVHFDRSHLWAQASSLGSHVTTRGFTFPDRSERALPGRIS
jgi:hypothetical protein